MSCSCQVRVSWVKLPALHKSGLRANQKQRERERERKRGSRKEGHGEDLRCSQSESSCRIVRIRTLEWNLLEGRRQSHFSSQGSWHPYLWPLLSFWYASPLISPTHMSMYTYMYICVKYACSSCLLFVSLRSSCEFLSYFIFLADHVFNESCTNASLLVMSFLEHSHLA
jgi:hypothetical protein